MRPAPPFDRVRFGPFQLDLKAGELHKHGHKIPLHEQPFQVLKMLLERPGEVVMREEIRKKLWPNDTIVEFDNSINAAIKKLRLALGDSAEAPNYVETVPRRGYRLMVPAERMEARPADVQRAQVQASAETQPPAQGNLIGKKVSHYRVVEILGGGGMGVVYQAEDLRLGRRVALKFLPEELAGDPAALGRFEREARAASALEHPNICPVYEFGEHDGQPFIVLQLLHGRTLRQCIEECAPGGVPFQTDQLLDLAIQIAEGLDAAHQTGIIHRDIKPANIFITNRSEAKILDFGLAKLVEAGDQPDVVRGSDADSGASTAEAPAKPSPVLTRTGRTMGTASYMSPEQVRGDRLDARTDLFSFGVVLYEMATGKQAFPADTMALVHEAILNAMPAPARNRNSELPVKLEDIINRALQKDRSMRYQTASEMRTDLRSAAAAFGSDSVAKKDDAARWWRAGLAGVFALLVIATVIVWLSTRRASFPPGLPDLKQRQLTANSSDNAVGSGAISPDGRYLAYADLQGIHIKVIETGDTQTVPQPEKLKGVQVNWAIVPAWVRDGAGFIANAMVPGQRPSIWTVPVMGGAPRKVRDDAFAYAVSRDGAWVAFQPNLGVPVRPDMWVMRSDGAQARKLFEADKDSGLSGADFSPDGQRLAYFRWNLVPGKFARRTESRDLKGGPATTAIPDSSGQVDWCWSPDGRIIYSILEPGPHLESCNFWAAKIDGQTGKPLGEPKRLTNWAGFCMDGPSPTADGKRLSFRRWSWQSSVHVAGLEAGGTRITTSKRLTQNEGRNYPFAWTADSKAVVFGSYRDGKWGIFKQFLNEDTSESVATGAEVGEGARTSPDGAWLLYVASRKEPGVSRLRQLMRVPITGGPAQAVLTAPFSESPRCARSPAALCAIAEWTPEGKQLVFTAFDPLQGSGRELNRFDIEPANSRFLWDLSPDGTRIAVLKYSEKRFHILLSNGGRPREIVVKGWNGLQSLNWAADGDSLFASSPTPSGSALLHLDLQGNARVLWEQKGSTAPWGMPTDLAGPSAPWAVPSPDGRHLAIYEWSLSGNIWMIENF